MTTKQQRRHAFWTGFSLAAFVAVVVFIVNAQFFAFQPGYALTGCFALGMIGWVMTR